MLVGKQLWVCMWSGERIWWLLCCTLCCVCWIGTQGKADSSGKTLLTTVLFEDSTCSILLLYFGQLECCGWTVSRLVLRLSWIQIIIALQPAGADMHKDVSINPPHTMPEHTGWQCELEALLDHSGYGQLGHWRSRPAMEFRTYEKPPYYSLNSTHLCNSIYIPHLQVHSVVAPTQWGVGAAGIWEEKTYTCRPLYQPSLRHWFVK